MAHSFTIAVLTAALFAAMTFAMADPAGELTYPPIPEAPSEVTGTTVVQPGDHFWKISEHHLENELDRPPSDTEVGPYWRKTIETNVASLRSGDPDLIYPGEVIVLPADVNGSR
jgi:nucleoid-associated protein YgaU